MESNLLMSMVRQLSDDYEVEHPDYEGYRFTTDIVKQEALDLEQHQIWPAEPSEVVREEEHPVVENSNKLSLSRKNGKPTFTDIVVNHVLPYFKYFEKDTYKNTKYWMQIEKEIVTEYPEHQDPLARVKIQSTWSHARISAENKWKQRKPLMEREQLIINEIHGTAAPEETAPRIVKPRKSLSALHQANERFVLSRAVCDAVAPYAHLMHAKVGARNTKYWDQIEQDLLNKYPQLKCKDLRLKIQGSFWKVRQTAAAKRAGGQALSEHEELALSVPDLKPGDNKSPQPRRSPPSTSLSTSRPLEPRQPEKRLNQSLPNLDGLLDLSALPFDDVDGDSTQNSEAVATNGGDVNLGVEHLYKMSIRHLSNNHDFVLIACKAVGKRAHLLKTINEEGYLQNRFVWDQIQDDVVRDYPGFANKGGLRDLIRNVWNRTRGQAVRKKEEELEEHHKIALKTIPETPGPSATKKARVSLPAAPTNEVNGNSDVFEATPVSTRTPSARIIGNNHVEEPKAAVEPVRSPFNDHDASLLLTETESNPNTTRETSVMPGARSLPFTNLLKVVDFCKRTNHSFKFDGDELVFTDRDTPNHELRFPIDRVDQLT